MIRSKYFLEADPETDWSQVSIDRLRAHLVDMNEVTLKAETRQRRISKGLEIEVTGQGAPERRSDAWSWAGATRAYRS